MLSAGGSTVARRVRVGAGGKVAFQVSVDPDISPSLSRADMLQRAFELVTREVLSDGQL